MNVPKAVMLLSGGLDSTTTLALGVDYGMALPCYDPSPTGEACGHCDACLLRIKGFAEASMADSTRY
ncbi:MAG TPA: 7-cyano-7-deazaguanine synthase [Ktedonobacterales bacterium]|jgi:7-cyano-7-deazaguanine synthase|nr:7-cyano-7-deazaguanine synthase [Ktedonobacterales bacterium]